MLDNDELDARALALDAARESRQRFQLEAFADINIGDGPEWLVGDIVPAAGFTVIYGEAGCGKSFLASDMGLAVALGYAKRHGVQMPPSPDRGDSLAYAPATLVNARP